jgi:hypothetical protein
MDRSHQKGRKRGHPQFLPIVWIAVLLGFWVAVVEWQMLPDLVSATMAALP